MTEKKKSSDNNNEDQLEPNQKKGYPLSIAFIIGNEFCERFSYYGAKAILVLFFRNVLLYSEDSATEYYHIFAMACYFTPVLGAIIADSLLGKFRTIFYISILYAAGNIVLSYASFAQSEIVTWVGLVAIALGTGGIKPCVSAFGGDQFGPGQEKQLQKFFSLFYISINAGSLLSTFITPILREDVQCFGRLDCFPLAFGVPAILMIVALLLFVLGKVVTGYVMVPPKKGNVVVQVADCVFTSISRKFFKRMPKRDHWLDFADDKYDAQTIADIKAVMRVLFLYLPLPIFWALFDQQGSRWTLQATKMDGNLFNAYRLKPDQIQVVNPLLIILMIPVFEYLIYPLLAKANLLKKPLQRIVCGGCLAALSFIICGFFQLRIEAELPTAINPNSAHLAVVNGLSTEILISNNYLFKENNETLKEYNHLVLENIEIHGLSDNLNLKITLKEAINGCPASSYSVDLDSSVTNGAVIFITESICGQNPTIQTFSFPNVLAKPADGGAYVGLLFNIDGYDITDDSKGNGSFWFRNEQFDENIRPSNVSVITKTDSSIASVGYLPYKELDIHLGGNYELSLLENEYNTSNQIKIGTNLEFQQGGSFICVVTGSRSKPVYRQQKMVEPNSVSMLWQVVQYFVITCGEVMFSITGLEFSYQQAPQSMKAVLQAAWLLTVAFGNVIVVIIAAAKIFERQSYEFFFFGGLMVADMIVFASMAFFYVPYNPSQSQSIPFDKVSNEEQKTLNGKNSKEDQNGSVEKNGVANDGFDEEGTKF